MFIELSVTRNLKHTVLFKISYLKMFDQGISQQSGTRHIAHLIAIFPGYFVFKNENVKVKVKYGFVLHTGFAGSPFYFRIITSYLKMSGMPCLILIIHTLYVHVCSIFRIVKLYNIFFEIFCFILSVF